MQESNANKLGLTAVVAADAMSLAPAAHAADFVKLQFSDGRPDVHGLENGGRSPVGEKAERLIGEALSLMPEGDAA